MTNEKRLQVWSECVGRFLKLDRSESEVCLVLSSGSKHIVLRFPVESLEAETLRRELSLCEQGAKIAVIKTDEEARPLIVKVIST
jgi:hypothetical protein